MQVNYFLTAYHSRPDSSGNVYWGFRFTNADDPNQFVEAVISGGESNIYDILLKKYWEESGDGWDRSIIFNTQQLKIREFDKRFKRGVADYAGCLTQDIVNFIKEKMQEW